MSIKKIQNKDSINQNFVNILNRYRNVFEYNRDAAKFIANNGTFHDPRERQQVLQVDELYETLNDQNRELGFQMKNRLLKADELKNREITKAK